KRQRDHASWSTAQCRSVNHDLRLTHRSNRRPCVSRARRGLLDDAKCRAFRLAKCSHCERKDCSEDNASERDSTACFLHKRPFVALEARSIRAWCYFLEMMNVGTIPPPAVTFANSFDASRVNAEPTLPIKSSGSRSTSCSAI